VEGTGGANDITRGKDGNFYIASKKTRVTPPICASAMDKEMCSPAWLAAMSTASGVDSRGDIYAGLTQNRSVDKFVRQD
jgi:hypothetical protein